MKDRTTSMVPVDLDLEAQALRMAVWYPQEWDESGLTAEHFAIKANRVVLAAVLGLRAEGSDVDALTILARLRRSGVPDSDKLYSWVVDITDVGRLTDAAVRALQDAHTCRRIASNAAALQAALSAGNADDARAALAEMQAASEADQLRGECMTAHDGAFRFLSRIESGERGERVHLGIEPLTKTLGPVAVGGMTVVGARPNVGKTSFGVLIQDLAERAGTPSAMITAEDAADLIDARYLAIVSGVSARRLSAELASPQERQRAERALDMLKDRKMWREDCKGADHVAIMAAMSRAARMGAKLVVVDYLQTIRWRGKYLDPRERFTEIVHALGNHAAKVGVHLVLLSQLRRPVKDGRNPNRTPPPPTKDDLKETGAIEEKADNIILLWRDEDADNAPVFAVLEKAKLGGVGESWTMQRGDNGCFAIVPKQPAWAADSQGEDQGWNQGTF